MTISQDRLNKRTIVAGIMAAQMAKSQEMQENEKIDGKNLLSWVINFLEADESERASQALAHLLDTGGKFVIGLSWKYGDLDNNFITFKPKVWLTIVGQGKSFDFNIEVNSPLSVVAFSGIKDAVVMAPWNLDKHEDQKLESE